MTTNPTFEKALGLLAHPFSLAGLALLLLNDHLLRHLWPSWWTGKIGDAAWLAFTPFALAALLAWWIPGPTARREKWASALAFGLTGLGFALAKSLPVFHQMAVQALHLLSGGGVITLRRDPTDLLTLPVLALGLYLWHRPAPLRPRRAAWGWVALPLAALLTIANSTQPDPGVACLQAENGRVYASGPLGSYQSSDGGLTWRVGSADTLTNCAYFSTGSGESWQVVQSAQPGISFRYQPGQLIEISQDGGQSWQPVDSSAGQMSEAEQAYLRKTRSGNPMISPGPLDALQDPATGNVIFAMGHEGVLVYTRAGQWIWQGLGSYQPLDNFPTLEDLWVLTGDQALLALAAGLITLGALAMRWLLAPARMIVLALGTLAWAAVAVLLPPALSSSYGYVLTSLGLLATGLLLLPLALEIIIQLARRRRDIVPTLLGLAMTSLLLFLLPYLLWAYNVLPDYYLATGFAAALVLAVILAGFGMLPKQAAR